MILLRTLFAGNSLLFGLALGLVAFVAFSKYQRHVGRAEGAASTVAKIERQTQVINAKARKARDTARAPGAVERVLKNSCRDCKL